MSVCNKRLYFTGNYKKFFERMKLEKFEDFYNFSDGELVNVNTKRSVVHMTFDIDGVIQEFFVKRFERPHFKDVLHTIFNHGCICSQAMSEYKFALHLLDKGIETYHPACFGQKTILGFEEKSFLVTKKINGIALTEFISRNFDSMSQQEKTELVSAVGRFIRKIHDSGISVPDLYVWHIFVLDDRKDVEGNYNFAIIDLHRLKINVRSGDAFIRNLGALDYSMSLSRFDDQLRETLLEAYIGTNHRLDKETIRAKLLRRSDVLRQRRHRLPEY